MVGNNSVVANSHKAAIMKLNLTDDQLEKARMIRSDMKKRMLKLRSKCSSPGSILRGASEIKTRKLAKLRKLINEISKLEAKKARIRLETKMKITGLLTPRPEKGIGHDRALILQWAVKVSVEAEVRQGI